MNSSAGRRAPPAHSAGCICKRQRRRIQDMTSSSSSSSHHAHPTRTFQDSRCFIAFGELQDQLSFWVHSEDARHGNANFLVGKHVLVSAGRNGGGQLLCHVIGQILSVTGRTSTGAAMRPPLTLSLFPKAAKKGFLLGGNKLLMSARHSILNFSGFFSMTSLPREKQDHWACCK